jgi:hypothetical protein
MMSALNRFIALHVTASIPIGGAPPALFVWRAYERCYRPDLVIDLTRACSVSSVNPPGNEQPAAEYLGRRMQELGMSVDIQQVEPGRANVIGRIPGQGEATWFSRAIWMLCHRVARRSAIPSVRIWRMARFMGAEVAI